MTAVADTLLYSLDGEVFVETVTGNASAGRAAGEVMDGHLRTADGGHDGPA